MYNNTVPPVRGNSRVSQYVKTNWQQNPFVAFHFSRVVTKNVIVRVNVAKVNITADDHKLKQIGFYI